MDGPGRHRRGPACSATEGALDALTRVRAVELGPAGARQRHLPRVVREIAAAAVHPASDEAGAVHGVRLDVDGGRTATAVIAG